MSSVVSYSTRCRAWRNGRFRNNCDGRRFVNLVAALRNEDRGRANDAVGTMRRERISIPYLTIRAFICWVSV